MIMISDESLFTVTRLTALVGRVVFLDSVARTQVLFARQTRVTTKVLALIGPDARLTIPGCPAELRARFNLVTKTATQVRRRSYETRSRAIMLPLTILRGLP
jgi:hypothetical protein